MIVRDYWNECKSVRQHKLVDFCRKDKDGKFPKIAMVTLTQEESLATSINTERFVRRFFKDSETDVPKNGETSNGYQAIFENKICIEILFRACKNPDDLTVPFFKNPDDMIANLTTEEVGHLFLLYIHVRSELSPMTYHLSDEEVDAWVDRVSAEGRVYMLDSLSPATLGEFIVNVVGKLQNYRAKEAEQKAALKEIKS